MAYEESLRSITLDADANLKVWTSVPGQPGSADPNYGNQYKFVKVTGAHQVGPVSAVADVVVGVLQNKPQVTNQAATVAIRGVSNVMAGAAVAAGNAIVLDSSGRGVPSGTAGAGTVVVGIALGSAAAANQLFPCLLRVN